MACWTRLHTDSVGESVGPAHDGHRVYAHGDAVDVPLIVGQLDRPPLDQLRSHHDLIHESPLNDAGLFCVGTFVAPWESVREAARQIIGAERVVSVALGTAGAEAAHMDLVVPADVMLLTESTDRILELLDERRLLT